MLKGDLFSLAHLQAWVVCRPRRAFSSQYTVEMLTLCSRLMYVSHQSISR